MKTIPRKISVKGSLFVKSLRLAKSNLNKAGMMVLFDALFLVSIFALYSLSDYFARSLAVGTAFASASVFIAFSLIYYLAALLVYSFFKYSVLDYIKSLFDKTDFSFSRLGQFYSLNIIIAGIFFAAMLLFNLILAGIKQPYAPFAFIFMAIPYLLFLYAMVNVSHSLFYQGASIKKSIKEGFRITFTRMGVYRDTVLVIIFLALILWLLFIGSGYLVRFIGSKNYALYLTLYSYFRQASIIFFDITFYIAILINRISFYSLSKEQI